MIWKGRIEPKRKGKPYVGKLFLLETQKKPNLWFGGAGSSDLPLKYSKIFPAEVTSPGSGGA